MAMIVGWIVMSVCFGTVILFGAVGEAITEKVGNLNLGTPGIMCMGGAFGFASTCIYETNVDKPNVFVCIAIGLLSAFIMGMVGGLIYSFLTTTLRVNQNVVGLTLTIFGVGLSKFVAQYALPKGGIVTKVEFANKVFSKRIPIHLGPVGDLFFSYGFMVYLAIIIAIVATWFLNKTRTGLNLRAVGENPGTADAAGINVTKYKYLATCIGSGITALGGLYYILDFNDGTWATADGNAIEAVAWLSVALVIFIRWKPINAIWGAYLFGICYWAYNYFPKITGIKVNTDLTMMLPYVVTIVVLIVTSIKQRKDNQAPASLGLSYFREDR